MIALFDMTLRLWSLTSPLRDVVEGLRFELGTVHVRGEPMAATGRLAGRIADRHYASTATCRGGSDAVAGWTARMLAAVTACPALVAGLRDGTIAGTVWIARLRGPADAPMPSLDVGMILTAQRLGLGVLLENYTAFDKAGAPRRTMLTGP